MTKKRNKKTAAELMAELHVDPKFMAMKREQDKALKTKAETLRQAEVPLVEDLRAAGLRVGSVWDLANTSSDYGKALPILFDHLQRPYPKAVREGIARALAIPNAVVGWNILMRLFLQEQDESNEKVNQVKWALVCALGAAANDTVLDDVVTLIKDRKHGVHRLALVEALTRSSDPRARKVLKELSEDPDLKSEVRREMRRKT